MTATIAERVAAGAKFLDEHDRDWWRADVERAIDLDTLDLGTDELCILGQRCPLEAVVAFDTEYYAQARRLSGLPGIFAINSWAVGFGFQAYANDTDADGEPIDDELDEFDDLTAEWKRVITERRSA